MGEHFEQLNKIQREMLEAYLKIKTSLADISKSMGVSRQTLYREIMNHSYTEKHDCGLVYQSCLHFEECVKSHRLYRWSCPLNCKNYKTGRPACLRKYPFVCNYCKKRGSCHKLHYYYDATYASNDYHQHYSSSRSKPRISEKKVKEINSIVSPLIKKGQSIEVILANHKEIKVTPLTVRRWISKGYLDCHPSSLRMAGRRKPPASYDYQKAKDYTSLSLLKVGHKYTDYRLFVKIHPEVLVIQIDCVVGKLTDKQCVLTIHIVNYHFQFGIVVKKQDKEDMSATFVELFEKAKAYDNENGTVILKTISSCILTDNGVEFDDMFSLLDKYPTMHLFFCHPLSSFEKGACERNHELIRYVHLKGWTFDDVNQDKINLIFSHMNSYARKSLGYQTPYQKVKDDPNLGEGFLEMINISEIPCDDVTLNPSLIKKIKK